MKRSVVGIIIAVLAVGTIAGVVIANNQDGNNRRTATNPAANQPAQSGGGAGSEQDEMAAVQPASDNEVIIQDFDFTPAKLTVKKGTTVTWTNQDTAKHTATPDNPEAFKGSPLLAKGESYSYTFNEAGTYPYFCEPHPYMKATIEVVE